MGKLLSSQEFDFQWENLPSKDTEYTEARIQELLAMTHLNRDYFKGKTCLDVGCGNGRYTYAMLQLQPEKVVSIDISQKAIDQCLKINPNSFVQNLMTLEHNPIYDFVFCFGVLHHLPNPYAGFLKVASQAKWGGGRLFIMVYHESTQAIYEPIRTRWAHFTVEEKLAICEYMTHKIGGYLHGWYDAFNPKFNWSFNEQEIIGWFKQGGFNKGIKVLQKANLHVEGLR